MMNAEVLARGLSGWEALSAADQAVLDALPVAMCICTAEGVVTRHNAKAGPVLRKAASTPVRLLAADGANLVANPAAHGGTNILVESGGLRTPAIADLEPLRDTHGRAQGFIATFHAPVAKRADDQETLYRFTDQLYRAEKLTSVYEAALNAITSALHCKRASILLFDDDGIMRFVAARGLSPEYCKAVEGHTPWTPADRDPQPIFVTDIENADEPESLKETIRAEGIRSLAFIPLAESGGTIGKFMAYYDAPHEFTQAELDLAVTIARQLGFSIGRARAQDARRAAEAQVRRSEEHWRSVFEHAGMGIVAMDRNYVITSANSAFAAICGHAIENLIGRSCLDLTHPDDIEKNDIALEELTRTGEPVAFEKRYVTKYGRHVWARFMLSNGERGQLLAVVEDIDARKRADDRVRQSANQVALVMNAAPVPIAYVDKNLRYKLVNKAYAKRFELTPAECLGRHTTEVAGGAAMGAFQPHIDAALAGQSVEFEVEAPYANGMRVLHGHYEPEFDPAGDVAGFVAVVSDITERKRDEEALRASEQRFQLMADSAPVLVWMSGTNKACTWFNKPWLDFVGETMEQQLGEGWAHSVHPDDLETCRRTYAEAFDARRTFSSEYRVRRFDGEYRWLLDHGIPLFGAAGQFTGYIGSCIDITERRLTEERLRESEQRFRLVAESAPVMLWKGNEHGKCTYLNKALRDFWGVPFEQMATFDWTSTVHPEDRAALFDPFTHAMAAHAPFSTEARYRRADGEYRVLGTQAQPRFGPRGEFLGMIGVNVDVTERKRAEEQRTLLINELNHRVKNTLATVQSLASQTLRNTELSADARPMFEARLLALSRAHDVLTRQSWQGASLREVVDRALEPFRTGDRIRVEGVDVRLSPKQALALSMALHELATNAAKYGALSSDAGRVELAWRVAVDGAAELQLTWTESGGPAVTPPTRTGFGSRLIQRSLAHDLGGATSIDYRPQGVVSVIKTPVEAFSLDLINWS